MLVLYGIKNLDEMFKKMIIVIKIKWNYGVTIFFLHLE